MKQKPNTATYHPIDCLPGVLADTDVGALQFITTDEGLRRGMVQVQVFSWDDVVSGRGNIRIITEPEMLAELGYAELRTLRTLCDYLLEKLDAREEDRKERKELLKELIP